MKSKKDWKENVGGWMDEIAWMFIIFVFLISLAFIVYGILKLLGLVY